MLLQTSLGLWKLAAPVIETPPRFLEHKNTNISIQIPDYTNLFKQKVMSVKQVNQIKESTGSKL